MVKLTLDNLGYNTYRINVEGGSITGADGSGVNISSSDYYDILFEDHDFSDSIQIDIADKDIEYLKNPLNKFLINSKFKDITYYTNTLNRFRKCDITGFFDCNIRYNDKSKINITYEVQDYIMLKKCNENFMITPYFTNLLYGQPMSSNTVQLLNISPGTFYIAKNPADGKYYSKNFVAD